MSGLHIFLVSVVVTTNLGDTVQQAKKTAASISTSTKGGNPTQERYVGSPANGTAGCSGYAGAGDTSEWPGAEVG